MKMTNNLLISFVVSSFITSLSCAVPAKGECPGISLLSDTLMTRVWINGKEVTENKGMLASGSKLLKSAVILNEKVYAADVHLLNPADNEKLKDSTLTLLTPLKSGVCEYEIKDAKGIEKLGTFTLLEPSLLEPGK